MNNKFQWILILLIIPVIVLTIIGWGMYISNFNFINEYVIACGPIYSAFVALYVAQTKETNEKERTDEQRTATTEYLSSLIAESLDSITSEMGHYEKLANDLHQRSFEEKSIKSTSFHHCIKIEELYNDELYRSLIHREDVNNEQQLSEQFVKLLNAVNNAIFLKENVKNQFENYIRMHNKYSQIFVDAQMGYSALGTEIRTNPSGNDAFENSFLSIVNNYNRGIINESINHNLIESYRESLVTPLNQLAKQHVTFNHQYLKDLIKFNHEAKRALDKMDEFQKLLEAHLRQVHGDLKETKETLRNCALEINGTL